MRAATTGAPVPRGRTTAIRAWHRADVDTTTVTCSPDLAVIVPAAALAGLLVRRRDPRGYLPAVPLLATVVLLLPVIALSTALQPAAGITFTAGEVVGPVTGFAVFGTLATWLLVRLLRAVPTTAPEVPDVHVRA
jgi:hypothetical protein